MPVTVKMPDGKYVQMPDNPTPNDLAQLQLMASPSAQGVQGETAQEPSAPNAATEAGKGAVRGLASMGQTVADILPGVTVGGQPVNPLQNPAIQKLAENFSGLMGRNPDASPEQHGWGTAGEIAGGALMGAPGGKASLSLFEKAAPQAVEGAARVVPQVQLSALQEILADKGGSVLGHMLGGGTLGRMAARYGMRAVMKALQKAPDAEAAGGASIPQYGGGLSPEMLARMTAAGSQPLFSQGEQ